MNKLATCLASIVMVFFAANSYANALPPGYTGGDEDSGSGSTTGTTTSAAEITQTGKIVSLNACKGGDKYLLVTLDSSGGGGTYRMGGNDSAMISLALVAYEGEYTLQLASNQAASTKCGVSTSGVVESLHLKKSLNP